MKDDEQLPETGSINTVPASMPGTIMETPATFLKTIEAVETSPQARNNPGRSTRKLFALGAKAYGGTLILTGIALPIVASAVTLGLYVFLPASPVSNWYALVTGATFSGCAWLIISGFLSYFATAEGANARSYSQIKSRLYELKARLGITNGPDGRAQITALTVPGSAASAGNILAIREALAAYNTVQEMLQDDGAGLSWVLGIGYVNAWGLIHRAEEALIEIEPVEAVIRGAMHDYACIQDSVISNQEEILLKLVRAVRDLDPLAMSYFSEQRPRKKTDEKLNKVIQATIEHSQQIQQITRAVKRLDQNAAIDEGQRVNLQGADEEMEAEPDVQTQARIALREVRGALNEFRDGLWEGVVRARNHLITVIALIGLVTHGMLCLAILASNLYDGRMVVIGATVYYMLGAVSGLFGRLYKELTRLSMLNDYNLSLARLVAVPVLSGLAGIGGVLMTALFYSTLLDSLLVRTAPTLSVTTLQSVFQLHIPYYLLVAALFGLTPNLLIRGLQHRAEQYASYIQSSKSSV